MITEKELAELSKSVFSSDKGQKLLKTLADMYMDVSLYKSDSNEVYYNLGKHDLVRDLLFYFNSQEKDLSDLKLDKSDDDFF